MDSKYRSGEPSSAASTRAASHPYPRRRGAGPASARPGPASRSRGRFAHEREHDPRRTDVVGAQADRSLARRVVPAPPGLVGGRAWDREIGHVQPELADLGLVTEDEGAGVRTDAVRRDDQVEVAGPSARKRRDDPIAPIAPILEPRDMIAEDILGVFASPIIKDPGEVAAQDLQLRREAVRVRGAGGKFRLHPITPVDEANASFTGRRGPDVILDPHPPGGHAPRSADIDVLTAEPERLGAFDDDRAYAVTSQPVRQGRTGDARTGDQDGSVSHGFRPGPRQ